MKAVIFAGGVGTRLWPLSRKKTPKQFEKIIDDKSTLQLSVEMLMPKFKPEDIYIATGIEYVELVRAQINVIPDKNIIGEPIRRDVGPAVAFWMGYLSKLFPNEPTVVLWSDHLIRNKQVFRQILAASNKLLSEEPKKIIYFGHHPRFPSENLGWIETGDVIKSIGPVSFKAFIGFKYRPDKKLAGVYFSNSNYCWNLGSFATTPQFMYDLFRQFTPEIHAHIEKVLEHRDTDKFESEFAKHYSKMPEIHLDNAISEKIDPRYACVIVEDIGWSDVGAWEALKEALQKNTEDNVTHGNVMLTDCNDSLIYNYEEFKTIVGIDLEDFLVVNTHDVILVTRKSSVPKIKKLVESLQGTEHEDLT